ncbi:unnamed protein product [Rotaria magnacalcarata]|uniref:LTD domain-containing protein n=3 Tax=Rotaria magnacalcarata TaxID=392030 RepID=A0A816AP48_9BILA|nr:unnamed protein product [Rotaria magnacalcarata]CAF1598922.1 unnamed protein product [Rotaria magnacalcarata]CAF4001556.1 unnamed protein product [Rotaria magnacalcarata]CAF4033390.1 unnamed protein product [Rotaria magnacalcarata]
MDENNKNDNTIVTYQRRDVQLDPAPSYTSSLIVNLRQLQNDFQTQYQHDRHALNELNERLRHFVDRVQQLEAQNAKYVAQIISTRRPTSDLNGADIEWNERYLHLQSDLIAVSHGSIDFGLEVEMYQLQTAIYQQLIEIEQQWKDDRRSKLEQECNQTALSLNSLRASNSDLGREVETFSAARNDASQKYLRLTQDWSRMKKQSKEWALNMQMLKNQVAFYKNLRSHSTRGYTSTSVGTIDVKQFWASELDKVVKSIRRDFEQLYGTFNREMTVYYKTQLEELQIEVEQASHYQSTDVETYTLSQQTLQAEYEKVHKIYSYEKESYVKLEATYVKIESEYHSIQQQNGERLELLAKDLENFQDNVMQVAYDIEEMRRKKVYLEGEIIVYRHLLDSYGIYEYTVHEPSSPTKAGTLTRKFIVKSQKKGSIGIRECPPDGAYISLMNHSPDKVVELSKWVLKRRIDGKAELRYTVPDGVRLQSTCELRIFSKQGAAIAKSSTKNHAGASPARQELINKDIITWGSGNSTETFLFNQHGEEKAIFSQSIAVASNDI